MPDFAIHIDHIVSGAFIIFLKNGGMQNIFSDKNFILPLLPLS